MIQKVYQAGCKCAGTAGCGGHDYDDGITDLHGMNNEMLLREIVYLLQKLLTEIRGRK